ncbi:MAG: hypothetical protein ACK5L3_04895 [Oscillospiraceae bacterium]
MATKRPRYMISVDDEMFQEIEDYRFKNRFQTRSEATAELIRIGLNVLQRQGDGQQKGSPIEKPVDADE